MIHRKKSRTVFIRDVPVGGNNPIVIQSMTNTPAQETEKTIEQIEELEKAGCRVVRLAIPDMSAVDSLKVIRKATSLPLVADIHFDYRLAIASIKAGVDKIRINPGNIGDKSRVEAVVRAASDAKTPIRIGVNSGSLEKKLLRKYGGPTPEALVESALNHIEMFHSFQFEDIVMSIKASDVLTTISACRLLSESTDYPLHIGITESGTIRSGTIRSSVGIGTLLANGIGDTIRVSLTGDPVKEIYVAKEILKSLELFTGPTVISCPTCARTAIDIERLALEVEEVVSGINCPLKVAVMGCVVNGPGEAKDADIGVAGGNGEGLIFVKGEPIIKVAQDQIINVLQKEIRKIIELKSPDKN